MRARDQSAEVAEVRSLRCDDCGACCTTIGTPPFLGFEVYQLPGILQDEVLEKGFNNERDGKPCYWFDNETKKCSQYDNRPQLCQDFEVGGDGCLSYREYYQIQ